MENRKGCNFYKTPCIIDDNFTKCQLIFTTCRLCTIADLNLAALIVSLAALALQLLLLLLFVVVVRRRRRRQKHINHEALVPLTSSMLKSGSNVSYSSMTSSQTKQQSLSLASDVADVTTMHTSTPTGFDSTFR